MTVFSPLYNLYEQAKAEVDAALNRVGHTSLEDFIKAGNLEHSIFMLWCATRDLIYRKAIPLAEKAFLEDFLFSKKLNPYTLDLDDQIRLTFKELQEYTTLTRQWAWSLRQSVIPRRGDMLEKIVRMGLTEALEKIFSIGFGKEIMVSVLDTSGKRKYNKVDCTIIVSIDSKKSVLGLNIKGNIRERMGESINTRRHALEARTHEDVWHIFLSDGDAADVNAFRQIKPRKDGLVYTWTGLSQSIGIKGLNSIADLPTYAFSFTKTRLGI